MSFIRFYYDPVTEFDGLIGNTFAARVYPRVCAPVKVQQFNGYRPRVDLHESKNDDYVTATFELPGLTSKDVAIDVHQNRLVMVISGDYTGSDSEAERSYAIRERRFGKFSRTLRLPYGTNPEDVKAKMENGILTVTFPKTSPEQQAKRIIVE